MAEAATHSGVLHCIPRSSPTAGFLSSKPPLVVFGHHPSSELNDRADTAQNSLIFLGGLSDGLGTVPYVAPLASSLPSSWTLYEPILGSSYRQWGFSSLGEDVQEIEIVVGYLKKLKPDGRIVLLGHSTGSQMIMHYLLSDQDPNRPRPKIDGGIMQGCVSDREAITMGISPSEIDKANSEALSLVDSPRQGRDMLPLYLTEPVFGSVPISAKRWLSLSSPGPKHDGEDDYFSSDFSDERLDSTFGRLGKTFTSTGLRIAWLFGAADQYVPATVDRQNLVERWHMSARSGGVIVDEGSGVVPGATHTLKEGGESMRDVISRIVGFVTRL